MLTDVIPMSEHGREVTREEHEEIVENVKDEFVEMLKRLDNTDVINEIIAEGPMLKVTTTNIGDRTSRSTEQRLDPDEYTSEE